VLAGLLEQEKKGLLRVHSNPNFLTLRIHICIESEAAERAVTHSHYLHRLSVLVRHKAGAVSTV
jgi:hypothetical protein